MKMHVLYDEYTKCLLVSALCTLRRLLQAKDNVFLIIYSVNAKPSFRVNRGHQSGSLKATL